MGAFTKPGLDIPQDSNLLMPRKQILLLPGKEREKDKTIIN